MPGKRSRWEGSTAYLCGLQQITGPYQSKGMGSTHHVNKNGESILVKASRMVALGELPLELSFSQMTTLQVAATATYNAREDVYETTQLSLPLIKSSSEDQRWELCLCRYTSTPYLPQKWPWRVKIWISTVSPYPSVKTDQQFLGDPIAISGGVGSDVRGIPGDL